MNIIVPFALLITLVHADQMTVYTVHPVLDETFRILVSNSLFARISSREDTLIPNADMDNLDLLPRRK